MAGEQNLESAKRAYAAFSAGDAAGAMENIADDVEWITPGNSAISGTVRGKQEVGELWGKLAEKSFTTSPQYWFADDERVVVLTHTRIDGGEADQAACSRTVTRRSSNSRAPQTRRCSSACSAPSSRPPLADRPVAERPRPSAPGWPPPGTRHERGNAVRAETAPGTHIRFSLPAG